MGISQVQIKFLRNNIRRNMMMKAWLWHMKWSSEVVCVSLMLNRFCNWLMQLAPSPLMLQQSLHQMACHLQSWRAKIRMLKSSHPLSEAALKIIFWQIDFGTLAQAPDSYLSPKSHMVATLLGLQHLSMAWLHLITLQVSKLHSPKSSG